MERTLSSVVEQDTGEYRVEVLLLDGRSEDRSASIARRYASMSRPGRVELAVVDNEQERTPFAFNKAIGLAKGKIIGFGGAHTEYPTDYFKKALELMARVDAGVVGGGHSDYVAEDPSSVLARAMACLYKSRMGSGVAAYHRRKEPGYVDTVYGGFYRREVFDRIGLFNERLTRNQDNELNARVTSAGMKIYFDPSLRTLYVQKADFKSFIARGYRFGFFHPETWRANPRSFRVRHAAPAVFTIYLLSGLIISPLFPVLWWYCCPMVAYGLLLSAEGVRLMKTTSLSVGALTVPLFFLYHLSYGIGTLNGVLALAASHFRAKT